MRLATPERAQQQVFSGTTRAMVESFWPPQAQRFLWFAVTVDAGALRGVVAAAGASVTNLQNLNIFQDAAHGWHAVLAIGVKCIAQPDDWTVLVQARPARQRGRSAGPGAPDLVGRCGAFRGAFNARGRQVPPVNTSWIRVSSAYCT